MRTTIEPFYFGSPAAPLFGCLHAPHGVGTQGAGVVICQPVGQEYIRCHRALRQLASILARAGWPVLRFDYYGSGDSLGETEEATLARWVEDVHEAVQFLREHCRVTRMTLVGVRMGAALAMRFAAERETVERLVLWGPTVRGIEFVSAMRDQSADFERWMVSMHGGPRPAPVERDGPRDLLGFRYSQRMIDEMTELDLLRVSGRPSKQALVLDNCDDPAAAALQGYLEGLGVDVELERLSAPMVWLSEPHQALVPYQSLKFLGEWLGEPR